MDTPSILRFDTLDSTNAEAMRQAQAGEYGPLWIVAARQMAGRGRSGRVWESLEGNLHATLLWRLACPAVVAPQLSLLAGVAVIDAIRDACGALDLGGGDGGGLSSGGLPPTPNPPQGGGGPVESRPGLRLKWPNDILIGGAKTGGILIETSTGRTGILAAAIGIGINLAFHPELADQRTTHLAAHGMTMDPKALLQSLAAHFGAWRIQWGEGRGFAMVREAWLDRAGPLGERVSVRGSGARVEGVYVGLDGDGALLIADGTASRRRITFGDVALTGTRVGVTPNAD